MARVVRLTGLRQVVNVLYKGANLGSKCCSTRCFFGRTSKNLPWKRRCLHTFCA